MIRAAAISALTALPAQAIDFAPPAQYDPAVLAECLADQDSPTAQVERCHGVGVLACRLELKTRGGVDDAPCYEGEIAQWDAQIAEWSETLERKLTMIEASAYITCEGDEACALPLQGFLKGRDAWPGYRSGLCHLGVGAYGVAECWHDLTRQHALILASGLER
ncbi:hypothetical protein SAMN05421538_109117 [Paracoccus isoporae]|uniref:Lysozyme inhibitor LprI N-terminal domain-containing protein n=1 Tax=Paracoccus isoporae TaxID=591205 RepID=A0A1G7EZ66_9RHOB|nr:hypothetical protein [Paracoccus isoporae]SDE68635.1 hypothetical protein SAMN05421538_109117 [Paracoccus isoporae]